MTEVGEGSERPPPFSENAPYMETGARMLPLPSFRPDTRRSCSSAAQTRSRAESGVEGRTRAEPGKLTPPQ